MATPARILLVEDDPEQALLFGQVLRLAGYTVMTAPTAEEALKQLAAIEFALLLADWDLPGMDGDVLITMAKAQYPGMKTILFSNHTHVDEAAKTSGADGWVRKIEGIGRLLALVRKLLAEQGSES